MSEDEEIESEIRRARKTTSKDVLGQMAGPGAMKGASPVSRQQQAEIALGTWIRSHVPDASGALHAVLHRHIKGSGPLLDNLDRPLTGLADLCQSMLESDYLLEEFVREADVEWGQRMDERPHFEIDGRAAHPDDPYTTRSVREILSALVTSIRKS
jgi:hypothetical protein